MVVFEVNKQQFEYPQNWAEITLQQLIDFYKDVEPKKPERAKRINQLQAFVDEVQQAGVQDSLNYKDEYNESLQELQQLETELTEAEYIKQYLPYKAAYVQHFVRGLDAMQLHPESLEQLFVQLQDIFSSPPKQAEGAAAYTIVFEGVNYHLPPLGMKNSTLGEFIASVQAEEYFLEIAGNDFASLPHLLGILARPKDEAYNEEKAKQRAADIFPRLPMSEAWKMYFFLRTLKSNLQQILQTFTSKSQLQQETK